MKNLGKLINTTITMVFVSVLITLGIDTNIYATEYTYESDISNIEILEMYNVIKEAGLEEGLSENLENKLEYMEAHIDPEIYVPDRKIYEYNTDQLENDPEEIIDIDIIINEVIEETVQETININKANEPIMNYTIEEREILSKILYHEARSDQIPDEQKEAVIWTILNRLDADEDSYLFKLKGKENNITNIATYPNAYAYIENTPVLPELMEIVDKALYSYEMEKQFGDSSGRVLPKEYLYFHGSGGLNHFRIGYTDKTYYQF